MKTKQSDRQPIQTYIVKRGERILGTFHSMEEAEKYVPFYLIAVHPQKPRISIEYGNLEQAEILLKGQREKK